MPGPIQGPVPIIRMYGVTADGNTVLAHVSAKKKKKKKKKKNSFFFKRNQQNNKTN